ncbi:MAG: penicillin-binding protein activator [Gammaproteobacteria bacterium]|nr:penicillin-binding protein activator [Gammaproteobacteria bacterium]
MSKLYSFIILLIVILFFTGCGGTSRVKDNTQQTGKGTASVPINGVASSTMSIDEKMQYAENLYTTALSKGKGLAEKNTLLSNALLLCSQVLTEPVISPQQQVATVKLASKILAQTDRLTLSQEQKNQYLLTSASIQLANYQVDKALDLLNQDFNSSQAGQWSMYHKLRAMTQYQLGQKTAAIKELIIRHGYLSSEQQKQNNQNLIWKYLSSSYNYKQYKHTQSTLTANTAATESERIYNGWIELAQIFRETHDPRTLNRSTNFWLQSYPGHQADRAFINRIMQARQESILSLKQIAVLLPLQGKLAKPARAIRDGILASHYKSPLADDIQLRFYDTSSNDPIWLTYQQAIDNGAEFVIGPLAKSNVKILSESTRPDIPTLALNSVENPSATLTSTTSEHNTNNLFQFGLSPESEARMVAEKGRQDGHYYAAVMVPENLWGKRMKKAFTEHWEKQGGKVVESVEYQSQAHDFSETIKSMLNMDQSVARKKQVSSTIGRNLEFTPRRRQDIDMLFMAAFPRQAKQIPLQIIYHHGETIPIYSTAHIVANYHNAKQNIDMDGVIFSDMPFLLEVINNAASQQNTYQSILYQRLFAMGVDSYQLAPYVNYLFDNPSESFAGDTGQITINPAGHIIRSLPWATFEQGKLKLESTNLNTDNAALY